MDINIKVSQKINNSMEKEDLLRHVEIFIKENLKTEKPMELEFLFKNN
jgi:hypothetical protein